MGVLRSPEHSTRLSIDFIDGARNDVVKVYVVGKPRQTGTTSEDYFRWCAIRWRDDSRLRG